MIVLGGGDAAGQQEADARTLVTLLYLRTIAERTGAKVNIVSEMLDIRNRELARVTKVDDFIVSNNIISLMLAQVSENKHLNAVFSDLLDTQGQEIYLKPAADYVETGKPVNFYTITEAARRRGEVAIGYRLIARRQARAPTAEEATSLVLGLPFRSARVVTPSKTSTKRVVSGDRPNRTRSGARKSAITPRPASSATSARAARWATATCAPRRCRSRGVRTASPWASARAIARSPSASAFAAIAAIPASAVSAIPSSAAARARIAGVPTSRRARPRPGAQAGPMANGSRWPNQPWIGWAIASCSGAAT